VIACPCNHRKDADRAGRQERLSDSRFRRKFGAHGRAGLVRAGAGCPRGAAGKPLHLEQAFEIRLELRQVLNQLGEVRRMLERLREAEALAER